MAGNSATIPGSQLINYRIFTLNLQVTGSGSSKGGYTLLTGTVVNQLGNVMPNSAIKVYKVNKSVVPAVREYVGITFSDENGIYGISLQSISGYDYELVPYSTL